MICLWYIIERLDKTIGWLERPGTVKSDLQNDHLTKLNGIQYTVYIQFKKWHWCRVFNMYEGGGLSITPQSFVWDEPLGSPVGQLESRHGGTTDGRWTDLYLHCHHLSLWFLFRPLLLPHWNITKMFSKHLHTVHCMHSIYYRNNREENTDLALALEPLVVLLQAPQEVQGQNLPEHTQEMYKVDENTSADTTSVTRAVRVCSCTHLSDGLQLG